MKHARVMKTASRKPTNHVLPARALRTTVTLPNFAGLSSEESVKRAPSDSIVQLLEECRRHGDGCPIDPHPWCACLVISFVLGILEGRGENGQQVQNCHFPCTQLSCAGGIGKCKSQQ